MKHGAHWIVIALSGLILLLLLGNAFSIQAVVWYNARRLQRIAPELALKLRSLQDTTANQAEGTTVSDYGYAFEVPWTDVDKIEHKKRGRTVVFKSGRHVSLVDPAAIAAGTERMGGRSPAEDERLRAFLGPEAMGPNYNLKRVALAMTPDQVSIFMPRNEATRNFGLLVVKSGETGKWQSAFYLVTSPSLRGFQEGDPARDPWTVLDLFDKQDHEVQVVIAPDKQGNTKITQADVNRIIQTLHPTAESK